MPWTAAHQAPLFCLQGSSVHWDSPGRNTGVGCHAFLQGIFPTQELNPGLLHCRQILYCLSHQGSPRILHWVDYTFSQGSSGCKNPMNRGLLHCRWILHQCSYQGSPIWIINANKYSESVKLAKVTDQENGCLHHYEVWEKLLIFSKKTLATEEAVACLHWKASVQCENILTMTKTYPRSAGSFKESYFPGLNIPSQ